MAVYYPQAAFQLSITNKDTSRYIISGNAMQALCESEKSISKHYVTFARSVAPSAHGEGHDY